MSMDYLYSLLSTFSHTTPVILEVVTFMKNISANVKVPVGVMNDSFNSELRKAEGVTPGPGVPRPSSSDSQSHLV